MSSSAEKKREDELTLQPAAGAERPRSGRASAEPVAPRGAPRQRAPWLRVRLGGPRQHFDAFSTLAVRIALLAALVAGAFLAYHAGWPYLKGKISDALSPTPSKGALAEGEGAGASGTRPRKSEERPKKTSQQLQTAKAPASKTGSEAAKGADRQDARPTGAPVRKVLLPPGDKDAVGMATDTAPHAPPAETQVKTPDTAPPAAPAQAETGVPAAPSVGQAGQPSAAGTKPPSNVVDDEETEVKQVGAKTAQPAVEKEATEEKKAETEDAATVLGLKKKEAEKAAPAGAGSPVAVTGGDPAFVPFDVQKMDSGHDKSFTMTLANVLPGWRGKDVNEKNCSVGITHRGRDGVLAINPINEVLPTKLIASVDVPPKSKAKLLFEVASKDTAHDWLLSVRVANTPAYQRVPVKTAAPAEWREVPVDLSAAAGKRVEVVLEIAMNLKPNPKTSAKTYAEQVGYIRNVRLEWPEKGQK